MQPVLAAVAPFWRRQCLNFIGGFYGHLHNPHPQIVIILVKAASLPGASRYCFSIRHFYFKNCSYENIFSNKSFSWWFIKKNVIYHTSPYWNRSSRYISWGIGNIRALTQLYNWSSPSHNLFQHFYCYSLVMFLPSLPDLLAKESGLICWSILVPVYLVFP